MDSNKINIFLLVEIIKTQNNVQNKYKKVSQVQYLDQISFYTTGTRQNLTYLVHNSNNLILKL